MFSQRNYSDDKDKEIRIIQLKQLYLEKQLQIESLERDRENTLRLLNEAKQQSPVPKPKNANDLLEEARRRKHERKLFEKPNETEFVQNSRLMHKHTKGHYSHREINDNELFTTESPEQQVDDFKEYIDKEYFNLKVQLEKLRRCAKKEVVNENLIESVTSLSNLSEISAKQFDQSEPFYSFVSNPLKSPQNLIKKSDEQNFVRFDIKDEKKDGEKRENFSKAFQFTVEKPNLNGILKKHDLKLKPRYPKFTLESNNIEILPQSPRKTPDAVKPKLSEFSSNFSIPARFSARSASNKRESGKLFESIKKKHKKDRKVPVWANEIYAGRFNIPYIYPANYMPFPASFPQYPTGFYPANKNEDCLTEDLKKNFQPFLMEENFMKGKKREENEFCVTVENNGSKESDFESNEYEEKSVGLGEEYKEEGKKSKFFKNENRFASIEKRESEPDIEENYENCFGNKESEAVLTFGKESSEKSEGEIIDKQFNEDDISDSSEKVKKPVLIEIGESESKTLAQIFYEKRQKLAENIQNREDNLIKRSRRTKSKNELIEIRKTMLRGSTRDNLHTCESEKNGSKRKRQKSQELTLRLASGQRAKITKEEMYQLNKKNYKQLPEVRFREEEENRKKEKLLRLVRAKQYEKVIYIQNLSSRKKLK